MENKKPKRSPEADAEKAPDSRKSTYEDMHKEYDRVWNKVRVAEKEGLIDKKTGKHFQERLQHVGQLNWSMENIRKLNSDLDSVISLGKKSKRKERKIGSELSRIKELKEIIQQLHVHNVYTGKLWGRLDKLEYELKFQEDPNNKKEAKKLGYPKAKEARVEIDKISEEIFELQIEGEGKARADALKEKEQELQNNETKEKSE